MTEVVIAAIASVAGYIVRRLMSEQAWRLVRIVARSILADPTETNDPREAVRIALAEVHAARVAAEAKKIANGSYSETIENDRDSS